SPESRVDVAEDGNSFKTCVRLESCGQDESPTSSVGRPLSVAYKLHGMPNDATKQVPQSSRMNTPCCQTNCSSSTRIRRRSPISSGSDHAQQLREPPAGWLSQL